MKKSKTSQNNKQSPKHGIIRFPTGDESARWKTTKLQKHGFGRQPTQHGDGTGVRGEGFRQDQGVEFRIFVFRDTRQRESLSSFISVCTYGRLILFAFLRFERCSVERWWRRGLDGGHERCFVIPGLLLRRLDGWWCSDEAFSLLWRCFLERW